jgi:hypothetical protein
MTSERSSIDCLCFFFKGANGPFVRREAVAVKGQGQVASRLGKKT